MACLASVLVNACHDPPTTTTRIRAPSMNLSDGTLGLPQTVRDEEGDFAELARVAPSSAGFYFDTDGRLAIRVRDASDNNAALSAASTLVAQKRISRDGTQRGVSYRLVSASFTFRQLAEWRDLAFDNVLLAVPDVYSLDLDEVRNRVAIGVSPDNYSVVRATALRRLTSLGVDPDALVFDSVGKPVSDVLLSPPPTLNHESSDPLAGGLRVDIYHPAFPPYPAELVACTLGFVAARNGQLGFVTASHCTDNTFGVFLDPDPAYQLYTPPRLVATEAVDPDGSSCGAGQECRFSDAAFFASNLAVPMRVGTIHRTYFGSTGIDPGDAYWYVTAQENNDVFVGQEVHKVGRVTGTTSGTVLTTCSDVYLAGGASVMICGYAASYGRNAGDSGGPVFQYDFGSCQRCVRLVGTHSGTRLWPHDNDAVFSKLYRIKSDLGGTWSVLFTPGLAAPSIGGSITNGRPVLSWSSVPGATRYDVYRGGGSYYQYVTYEIGKAYTDATESVVEVLPGPPAPGVAHTAYYIIARSSADMSPKSNTLYFRKSTAPTITVSIDGPTQALQGALCYWRAIAGGGTGSYTYSWKVNNDPQGPNADLFPWPNQGATFQLSVDVTDGVSQPGNKSQSITVWGGAPSCELP